MKMNRWLAMAAMAAVLVSGATLQAQQSNNGGNGGRRGNWDPAQRQQMMMDRFKEEMGVTDDAEWNVISPRIQKVTDIQRQMMADRMRGMFGSRRGGDNGGDQNRSRGGFFGAPSPEADALQRAIDSKASNSELKAAVAKYTASRKAKQTELEKAQADLRQILSAKQEAVLTLAGIL